MLNFDQLGSQHLAAMQSQRTRSQAIRSLLRFIGGTQIGPYLSTLFERFADRRRVSSGLLPRAITPCYFELPVAGVQLLLRTQLPTQNSGEAEFMIV
jgi:hypothetical protein